MSDIYNAMPIKRTAKDDGKDQFILSTETRVDHGYFDVVLSHMPDAVDLSYLRSVGSFIFQHDPTRIIGPLYSAELANGQIETEAGYDDTDEGKLRRTQIQSGSLKGISVRARPLKAHVLEPNETVKLATGDFTWSKKKDTVIVTRWMPIEQSATVVPRDVNSQVKRSIEENFKDIGLFRGKEFSMAELDNSLKDEIRTLIKEEIARSVGESVAALKDAANSNNQNSNGGGSLPGTKIESAEAMDFINRAQAISLDAKSHVADMIFSGKSSYEINKYLYDTLLQRSNAKDNEGNESMSGDTGRGAPAKFKDITAEVFLSSISNPVMMF